MYDLLDSTYVSIRRSIYNDTSQGNRYTTDLLIYSLKDLNKPIVKINDRVFSSIVSTFFIKNDLSSPKISFSILGENVGFILDCDENEMLTTFNRKVMEFSVKQYPNGSKTHNKLDVQYQTIQIKHQKGKDEWIEKIDQGFYFDHESKPILVYPLYHTGGRRAYIFDQV